MPLLDLPNELFVPIIERVVRDVGRVKAAELRLVCPTFHVSITRILDDELLRIPLSTLLRDDSHAKYFETQGGRILHKKLFGKRKNHPVIKFIKEITVNFIASSKFGSKCMRIQVVSCICNAMMALKPKMLRESILNAKTLLVNEKKTLPLLGAIAASVGDEETHSKAIQDLRSLFESGSRFFPSALDASVAAGHVAILEKQLQMMDKKIKDMHAVKDWKSMRDTAKYIGNALMVAIRLHRNDAGVLLFRFFQDHKDLRNSRHYLLATWLFQDAVRTTNKKLIYSTLELVRPLDPTKQDRYKLDGDRFRFLFRSNTFAILSMMLRDGHILPNEECEGSTLLAFALEKRRQGVASILLKYGADIDGLSSKQGVTALWHAVKQGYFRDVLFLIQNGAKLDYPTSPEKSPLKMVKDPTYDYKITKWMMKRAETEEGRDSLKESDCDKIIDTYKDETYRWNDHWRF